ncbi:MAG: hypothetical protein NZ949_04700, partial [Candidatus Kapabacteria bacterium]|nr:hypothetical protein [Candidatus Kapabacteria bacterium]MDW7997672.1 hypothetical protein [Bacteroidota bacterium]
MAEYQLAYHRLRRRLLRTQHKELLLRLIAAEAWAGSLVLALLVAVAGIETFLFAGSTVRMVLWHAWIVISACLLVGAALPSLTRLIGVLSREPLEKLALRIGAHYPSIGDMLCNALQLMDTLNRRQGTSAELALAAFAHVAQQAEGLDFDAVLDYQRARRAGAFFFSVVGIGALLLGVVTPLRSALHRLVLWEHSFVPPPPFALRVEPREATVVRGMPVSLRVYADGVPPTSVRLYLLPEQGPEYVEELQAKVPGMFTAELGPLGSSLRFYATARWFGETVASPEGKILVIDRPILREIRGEVRPPAY